MKPVENQQALFKHLGQAIPLCDSNAYLEDKTMIGRVLEVLGPLEEVVRLQLDLPSFLTQSYNLTCYLLQHIFCTFLQPVGYFPIYRILLCICPFIVVYFPFIAICCTLVYLSCNTIVLFSETGRQVSSFQFQGRASVVHEHTTNEAIERVPATTTTQPTAAKG